MLRVWERDWKRFLLCQKRFPKKLYQWLIDLMRTQQVNYDKTVWFFVCVCVFCNSLIIWRCARKYLNLFCLFVIIIIFLFRFEIVCVCMCVCLAVLLYVCLVRRCYAGKFIYRGCVMNVIGFWWFQRICFIIVIPLYWRSNGWKLTNTTWSSHELDLIFAFTGAMRMRYDMVGVKNHVFVIAVCVRLIGGGGWVVWWCADD